MENIPDILGTIPGDLLDHDLVNTIMNERDAKSQSEADGQQRKKNCYFYCFIFTCLCNASLYFVGVGDRSVQFHNTDPAHKDELADFITSQFTLDSGGLPSMDSKDVEDVFKGVFVDESHDPMFQVTANQPLVRPRPPIPTTPSAATAPPVIPSPVAPSARKFGLLKQIVSKDMLNFYREFSAQSSPTVPRPPAVPQNLASPASFPPPSPYHSEYSKYVSKHFLRKKTHLTLLFIVFTAVLSLVLPFRNLQVRGQLLPMKTVISQATIKEAFSSGRQMKGLGPTQPSLLSFMPTSTILNSKEIIQVFFYDLRKVVCIGVIF